MKINVRAIYDKTEVVFEIPIGMGDKSFKWLGNVVCSRFATSAPNGQLRRRDAPRRGSSDKATHQAVEMALSDGQIPHPLALLYDFVRDGDEVRAHLVDEQSLDEDGSGTPKHTEWATLAYGTGHSKTAEEGTEEGKESASGNSKPKIAAKVVGEGEHVYSEQQQLGRAQFVRILLKSQMLNPALVRSKVEESWDVVRRAIPNVGSGPGVESALVELVGLHWDSLFEAYSYFAKKFTHTAPDAGKAKELSQEGFFQLLTELDIFDAAVLKNIYSRIFARAAAATSKGGSATLTMPGLIVAILLCAQTKYNDTLDSTNDITTAGAALEDILNNYLTALTERYEMRSMLKAVFVSTTFLNQLREWHDELFSVFNKYASRSRELPSSISYKDFTDCLYDAGLTVPAETDTKGNPISFEYDTVEALLAHVRTGSIYGRPVVVTGGAAAAAGGLPDDIIPDDEFTYPEMVEAICVHAFNKYRGTKPDEETGEVDAYYDYAGDLTVSDTYVKGLVAVLHTLTLTKK
jgi:hypothetical protein